jgi:tellurite methyltransferase
MMETGSMQKPWSSYYEAVKDSPPHPTLLAALHAWNGPPGSALDLGCGAGRDTLTLLAQGWRVHAIDAEAEAIARLAQIVPSPLRHALTSSLCRFETADLPVADLVNASYSLPFCKPDSFPRLWQNITTALRPDGLFNGHLFGQHDSWSQWPEGTFHSRTQVELLLAGWEIVQLNEMEWDGTPAVGEPKHWHVFEIVARGSASAPRTRM